MPSLLAWAGNTGQALALFETEERPARPPVEGGGRRWLKASSNVSLRGVLPKDYARPALDKQRLGELIDLIGTIGFRSGDESKEVLRRVYAYFLGQFASKEGRRAASSARRPPSFACSWR